MKISEIIKELVSFDRTERDVYVTIFERDSNGLVISQREYPVEAVFSHKDGRADIYVEQPQEIMTGGTP